DAKTIYRDLYNQLTDAIDTINNAIRPKSFKHALGNSDIFFNENMTKWKQFANTLKLRLVIRAYNTDALAGITPSFDPVGFLTHDALLNPESSHAPGKPNPHRQTYHSSANPPAGNARSIIANRFVVSFYNGVNLSDASRARAIYRGATNP